MSRDYSSTSVKDYLIVLTFIILLFGYMGYSTNYKLYFGEVKRVKCVENYDQSFSCVLDIDWNYKKTIEPLKQNNIVSYVFDHKVKKGDEIKKIIIYHIQPCVRCIQIKYKIL